MSTQHTPGPWVVASDSDLDNGIYYGIFPEDDLDAARFDEDFIALTNLNHKNCEANARLIAEAPEMLKALRDIAAITTCTDQDPEAMCAEIQGICRVALAAHERGGAK